MKDLDKDIENKLKEQFNQQDFDIQDAWLEDMSTVLDDYNKKDNKKFFFWLFVGSILAVAASGFLWNNFYTSTNNNETVILATNKAEINASNNSENYKFTYTEMECEPNEITKEKTSTKSNKKKVSKKKSIVQKQTNTKSNTFKASKNKKSNKNINTSKSSFLVEKNNDASEVENLNSKINFIEDLVKEENKAQKSKTLFASVSEKLNNEKTIKEHFISQKTDSIEEPILENEVLDSVQESIIDKTNELEKKQTKNDLGLSLAINAGPSFVFRNFNSETQNTKRTNEERNKTAWNLNLELYKTFENNIILETGINITNYGEKIDYTSISETYKDTTYQTEVLNYLNLNISKVGQSLLYDTSAILYYDTTLVIKDSIFENTAVQKANGKTNFTYIEIPVLFGYRIINTKKWRLSATTGFSAGFLVGSKGNYVNTKNKLNPATNQKVIFNYLLAAQLNYNIYKNLNLSLAPNFKYSINNLSTYSATKKRYISFGINAGIMLDF